MTALCSIFLRAASGLLRQCRRKGLPNAGGCQERWNINGKTNDSDMKVKTCAETVDIRKGVPFVEMRIAGVPFMGMSVMVALSPGSGGERRRQQILFVEGKECGYG